MGIVVTIESRMSQHISCSGDGACICDRCFDRVYWAMVEQAESNMDNLLKEVR